MKRKAVIFGISGTKLTVKEKSFLTDQKPWGIILFSRNINNINQLKLLTSEIKNIFRDDKYPIIIDQEGGNVSRLNNILDFSLLSQNYFGELYRKKRKTFFETYQTYINTVSYILKNTGININTVPVLDIKSKKNKSFIGDRSFSSNPNIVSRLGNLCIDLYKKNKIGSVIKHIPCHGLTKIDSHKFTPVIKDSRKKLLKNHFKPFKMCPSFFAMTAHVIYKSYDSKYVCTHSKFVIDDVIRNYMKFKGIIISDDISMKALKFGLKINTTKALDAGCNLILHCNGKFNEMLVLSKLIPTIDQFTQKKNSTIL